MRFTARVFAAGFLFALPNLAVTSALVAQDHADIIAGEDPVWAFEQSDLEVDPAYVFGQLENGMRYS